MRVVFRIQRRLVLMIFSAFCWRSTRPTTSVTRSNSESSREIKRVKNGTYYQIPASPETRGHGTSGDAKWRKHLLPELLSDAKPGQ
jgi:hypothetical protein